MSLSILTPSDLEDFKALLHVFEDVFEMDDFIIPSDLYLASLLLKSTFKVFIAKVENVVVGGLTVYILDQYYSPVPQAYLYDLGVARSHQRKGIARELVVALRTYCAAHRIEEVFVQADIEDVHALEFYRSTSPSRESDVVHFTYVVNPSSNVLK